MACTWSHMIDALLRHFFSNDVLDNTHNKVTRAQQGVNEDESDFAAGYSRTATTAAIFSQSQRGEFLRSCIAACRGRSCDSVIPPHTRHRAQERGVRQTGRLRRPV